jgi:hypothetical protein
VSNPFRLIEGIVDQLVYYEKCPDSRLCRRLVSVLGGWRPLTWRRQQAAPRPADRGWIAPAQTQGGEAEARRPHHHWMGFSRATALKIERGSLAAYQTSGPIAQHVDGTSAHNHDSANNFRNSEWFIGQ